MTKTVLNNTHELKRNLSAFQRAEGQELPDFIFHSKNIQNDKPVHTSTLESQKINFNLGGYDCGDEPSDDDQSDVENSSTSSSEEHDVPEGKQVDSDSEEVEEN